MPNKNIFLVVGGLFSFLAGILHIAIIIGGPDWYRFFGAGEEMASMAENGSIVPAVVALFVTLILFIWAAYAFSAAGIIKRLPLLKLGLLVITGIYTLRTLLLPYVLIFTPAHLDSLIIWSSLFCLAAALAYAIGTWRSWKYLSK